MTTSSLIRTAVESVDLANARLDLSTLEHVNDSVEKERLKNDVLLCILYDRTGVKLSSLFEMIVSRLIYARIYKIRQLRQEGKVPTSERNISDTDINEMEKTIAQLCASSANDDAARCVKQTLVLVALVREPAFRRLFVPPPLPPHPHPNSNEAALAAAAHIRPAPKVNEYAFISFLKDDLYEAYKSIITGKIQRLDLHEWVVDRAIAYVSRLPLDK